MQLPASGTILTASYQYKKGSADGYCVQLYSNGDSYKGMMKQDKRNGLGSFTFANKWVKTGDYENDRPKGLGWLISPDTTVWMGLYTEWQLDGAAIQYGQSTASLVKFKKGVQVK